MTLRSHVDIPGVPKNLAKKIAQARGEKGAEDQTIQVANGGEVSDVLPVSSQMGEAETPEIPVVGAHVDASHIGKLIPNKGVYIGRWEPKDRDGNCLHAIFNLYAAPKDLGVVLPYIRMTFRLIDLKNYYGSSIHPCNEDTHLYEDIHKGKFPNLSGWFIPTADIIQNNLYPNKDKGILANTFSDRNLPEDSSNYYHTCTQSLNKDGGVWFVDFSSGTGSWNPGEGVLPASTRLVRTELVL